MAEVFEQTTINGMTLANRFVRSATWEGAAAEDGAVTPRLIRMMLDLAEGGVGLIITSYAYVMPEGQSSPRQIGAYDDRFVPGWRAMADAVHKAGSVIALQLVHGGCGASPELTGLETVGPSVRVDGATQCRAASLDDIKTIAQAFAAAARRAKDAGFDAVQLHGAHGYILNQFLSPAFNKRTDEYGGSLENRARLLLDVVKGVRAAVGPAFPVFVKLNSEDFLEGGMAREEAVAVARMLEKASVDAVEYSGGTLYSTEQYLPPRPGYLKTPEKEAYYREAAALYKRTVNIPLMLVGGIRSFEVAEELVASRTADYISLARPLICEPGLINRWKAGDRRKAECISDNGCFAPALQGAGDFCATMAKKRAKKASAPAPE
ncbi:MAG: NADH:flavin oxidoreductase [Desulfovibrio sp.]